MTQHLGRLASGALVILMLWLTALPATATATATAVVGPGDKMPRLELSDQNNRPVTIDDTARLVIFAADKAGSDLAQVVLAAQDAAMLTRLQAVYVADISAMPALITRMFAMPRLRELPFAVALVRDAAVAAHLPRLPAQVTVLTLEAGQVKQIRHAADATALKQALGL